MRKSEQTELTGNVFECSAQNLVVKLHGVIRRHDRRAIVQSATLADDE